MRSSNTTLLSNLKIYKEDEESCIFQPHTLTCLAIFLIVMVYFIFFKQESFTTETNIKNGITASICCFLLYCSLQLNDSFFIRPHRVVWRAIKGVAILYLLFLVFLLFQTPEFTRNFFTYIDGNLGKQLPERSYAVDCRVYTPERNDSRFYNLKSTIVDEFVPAHFLGWFGKALIYRDFHLSWFMSIWFEVLEKSLKHVLPNFAECWWDHLLLDILICNGLGIYTAHKLLSRFEAQQYNWMGINNLPINKIPTTSGKLKRVLIQFMPVNWIQFKWDFLSSPRRYVGIIFLVFLSSLVELNCFFLKYVLWHPPPHYIVIGRLVLWWLFSLPASREYYEFVNNMECKKVGTMAWLVFAIVGSETLLWIKCSKGQFPHVNGHPTFIVVIWAIGLLGLFTFGILRFVVFKQHIKDKKE